MKKISILVLTITIALILALTPKSHAYTLSSISSTYYNQVTASIGESDVLDLTSTTYERMYYNLGTTNMNATIRFVFSSQITTEPLQPIATTSNIITVTITFYNSLNQVLLTYSSNFNGTVSFSYFENNFNGNSSTELDYITIRFTNLPNDYDEDLMHTITNGAIIGRGSGMIINQTVTTPQYQNGWDDAMNSKVTQIWSLWGNIFDTFMSVFDVFSVKLMGDITIGHLALVPLVLGLIGFIYALGGKRGR